MLVFVASRRDPDVKTACVMRSLSDNVNNPGGGPGQENDIFPGDNLRESLSFLDQGTARLQPRTLGRRRAHDPDFYSHDLSHDPTNAASRTRQDPA